VRSRRRGGVEVEVVKWRSWRERREVKSEK
jgi:hypothetical protein